jgi:hypothetical protein
MADLEALKSFIAERDRKQAEEAAQKAAGTATPSAESGV